MKSAEWQSRMRSMLNNYDPFKNLEQFEELVTEPEPIRTWQEFQDWFSHSPPQGASEGTGLLTGS